MARRLAVLRWAVPLMVLGGLITAGSAATQEVPRGAASLTYQLGSAFTGRAQGTCELAGLRVDPDGGSFVLDAPTVWLDLYTYEANSTAVDVPTWHMVNLEREERLHHRTVELPPGRVEVTWRGQVPPFLFAVKEEGAQGPPAMAATFTATGIAAEPVGASRPSVGYWVEGDGGDVMGRTRGPAGEHRLLGIHGGRLAAAGDADVYLVEASVEAADGTRIDMPPRYEVEGLGAAGLAGVITAREHFAFLRVRDATLALDTGGAQVACRGLAGAFDGAWTTYATVGEVRWDGTHVPVERNALTLEGSMDWRETMRDGHVAAEVDGTFRAVSLDFEPAAASSPLEVVGEASLWAGLLATLSYIGYHAGRLGIGLFTRLTLDDVLAHPRRRLILETVRAHPDSTLMAVVERTGIARPVVRHHLDILQANGLVRSYKVGRDRCFIEKGVVDRLGRRAMELRADVLARHDPVLHAVLSQLGPEPTRLGRAVATASLVAGVSTIAAWKAVRRGERYGLLTKRTEGREVWLCRAG